MKRIFICLVCLTLGVSGVRGQYYRQEQSFLLGVNAGYLYPTGDMGKILKNGMGGNLSMKYLINEVIGIGFEGGYYKFKSKIGKESASTEQDYKARLIPALLEATFYIPTWNRAALPYLGIQFGAYVTNISVSQKSVYDPYGSSLSKKMFMFSPGAGLHVGGLFQLPSERWYIDLRVRADYVPDVDNEYDVDEFTKGNIGFDKMLNIGANIGLLYRF